MKRSALACVLALLVVQLVLGGANAQSTPQFRLGFKALADQIPSIAGQPLENERYNPVNGDSLQRTTTGLMAWRKADNWTAFTNGSRTWVNGPYGVMERANDERFDWEADDRNQPGLVAPQSTPTLQPSPPSPSTRSGYPRVNLHPGAEWAKAAIFWFGRATEHDNYTDARVYYDANALYVYLAVTDYYLWADQNGATDPRQFDAAALYLDTGAATGGPYLFVSGFRPYPVQNDARWHRQARLTSSGWDYSAPVSSDWNDLIGLRYYNSGPNDNSDRDAGWATTFTIPWAALGLTGPPPSGSSWGMGIRVYDRDEPPPAGLTGETHWPGAFSEANPASWGSLVFDPAPFAPSWPATGTTVIRRGLGAARVQDAYVGGGGNCQGGIFGDGDRPHPTDDLFVQNQSDIADFPCFSKSFLSFDLGGIPPGKKIVAATLTLHSFGGSDPSQAKPSQVQLLTVDGAWDEATLTWNNAPMARENVSVTTVGVLPGFPGWPGVPFSWDAKQAVAEAYAAGKSANIVLYSTDSAYHSGKYFVSSDTGDWNAEARPTLTVSWAD